MEQPKQNRFLSRASSGVPGLKPYSPGKPLEELEREYGITDAIKLASNENPMGPSPKAMAAVSHCLTELHRYPDDGAYRLKALLAQKHAVSSDQIVLGNGSSNVLELLVRVFASVGDEVMFSQHAFAMYPILTQAVGATAVEVPSNAWGHDLPAMSAAITDKTKLVFIANPNNPTGTWLDRESLRQFLEAVPEQVIVVVDEAYFEFAMATADKTAYPDSSYWLSDFPNLVVTRTFSKAYGIAGLRVGYGICHSEMSDLLNRVRAPFNVNLPALAGAEAALADTAHIQRVVENNQAGLAQLHAGLQALGLQAIPSLANFVCVDVKQDGLVLYESLLRKGVIVRPRPSAGMKSFIRITVGTVAENEKLLAALT